MTMKTIAWIFFLSAGTAEVTECPKISEGGRCGPLFGGAVCSTDDRSWALYCNEDNGWCGNTIAHKNAQASTEYDNSMIPAECWEPKPSTRYSTLTSGVNACKSAGLQDVLDPAECTSAALELNLITSNKGPAHVQNEGDRPFGCRVQSFGPPVWINTRASSKTAASGVHKVICAARGCEGKTSQSWDYVNTDNAKLKIELLSASTANEVVKEIQAGKFNRQINTDMALRVQRDDSWSRSYIKYIRLDNGKIETFVFYGGYADHTNVELVNNGRSLKCNGNRRGQGRCNGLAMGKEVDVVLLELYLDPRRGSAYRSQWNRNRFTLTGTTYELCPGRRRTEALSEAFSNDEDPTPEELIPADL